MKKNIYISIVGIIILALILTVVAKPKENESVEVKKEQVVKEVKQESYEVQEFKNINELKRKVEGEESVVLYLFGNTCPHCIKYKPVLDDMVEKHKVKVYSFDIFIEQNNKDFKELLTNNTYGLKDIEYVPMMIVFKNGEMVELFGAEQWQIKNEKADLGYDINEKVINEFFSKDFSK